MALCSNVVFARIFKIAASRHLAVKTYTKVSSTRKNEVFSFAFAHLIKINKICHADENSNFFSLLI